MHFFKKKAFWKPQHKKSFFSPHKIHLSDKRTKLSNPPRSPTLDRKKEPTWLKNSWVDLNITKRVGKLKSTHKKEGQIFFFAGVQQHPPVRTIACLNSNSCCILKPVMPAQYVYVCVCVCVSLSLSSLGVLSLRGSSSSHIMSPCFLWQKLCWVKKKSSEGCAEVNRRRNERWVCTPIAGIERVTSTKKLLPFTTSHHHNNTTPTPYIEKHKH